MSIIDDTQDRDARGHLPETPYYDTNRWVTLAIFAFGALCVLYAIFGGR